VVKKCVRVFRAWIMHTGSMEDQARVFYLDYGNTAVIPWTQTRRASDLGIWDLPPMAIPFTLTGKQETGVWITIRQLAQWISLRNHGLFCDMVAQIFF
jgi:hypothetical protein